MVVSFDGPPRIRWPRTSRGISPKGVVQFAGNGRNTVSNPNLNKFGPRFGFACQLDSKTTVRGGYGLYWAPQFAIGSPIQPPGYNQTTSHDRFRWTTTRRRRSTYRTRSPSGSRSRRATRSATSRASGRASALDPNAKSPRVQQFSIDVQRQLPCGIATEVGYVGSHSTHLTQATANININALDPALLSHGLGADAAVANPFYQHGGAGVIGTATVQPGRNCCCRIPTFSTINYLFNDNSHAQVRFAGREGAEADEHGAHVSSRRSPGRAITMRAPAARATS